MALFFEGQKCPICKKEMLEAESIFSFSTFIQNTKDVFYQFNDSVFHISCLSKHPLGDRAIQFSNEYNLKTRPENRICFIGKNVIQNHEDYIFIDLLTSDEKEELYKFNFTTLDKKNLNKWHEKSSFINLAKKFKDDNKWGDLTSYKFLDNLIDIVKSNGE